MPFHLTFDNQWDECVCDNYCKYGIQIGSELKHLTTLPLKWSKPFLSPYKETSELRYWVNDNNLRHRIGAPAVLHFDGYQEWWVNGELHREDGPAITDPEGGFDWYLHDKLHRTDGPAIIHPDGTVEWWQNGERHRADGPAIIWAATFYRSSSEEWWLNGVKQK